MTLGRTFLSFLKQLPLFSQRILALNLPQLDPSDGWELYLVATGTCGIKLANGVLTGTR